MADSYDILAISGSLRAGSFNTHLLRAVASRAPEALRLDIITPRGVPLYDGDVEERDGIPPIVEELKERVRAADALVIATPEYNFSVPGVLKNMIDWLSRGEHQPFNGKHVGIMGASTGPIGTARSQYHLRMTLQSLYAVVMPRPEIFVTKARDKFASDGTLTDEATEKIIATWLKHFEPWARLGQQHGRV
jgi:chromate reductase, NAD(P)H dehydrogenase (quinone)